MRRENRRREERRRAATKAEEDIAETSEQSANVKPKCDSCETGFNLEEELSAHIQSAHTTPEKERGSESQIELQLSPIQMQRSEEKPSEQDSASFSAPDAVATSSPKKKSVLVSAGQTCFKEDGYLCYPLETEALCGDCFWNHPDLRRRQKERRK